MSEEAAAHENEQTPSAGDEPAIPKWRFDQVNAQLRDLREANQIKDQTIASMRQQFVPPAQPDPEEEELLQSLDPTQLRAVSKLIDKRLGVKEKEIRGLVGHIYGELDTTKFLLHKGRDKDKYLPRIKEMQRESAARGVPLSAEDAYRFIRAEEMDALEAKASAQMKKEGAESAPAEKKEVKEKKEESTPPPAQATHSNGFSSIEELEANLDEQIKASGKTF